MTIGRGLAPPAARGLAVTLLTILVLATVGCSQAPTATPTPTGITGSLPPPATGTSAPSPSPSPSGGSPGPSASPASTGPSAIRIDPSLLAILPTAVGGATLIESPETEGPSAADRALAVSVDRLVTAFASSPDGSDFALAWVVALKTGAFSDRFYADWRETFNQGACSQAGGVTGSAESTIGGRAVFIGRCAGGLLTYHAYLPGANFIVSVSSLGPKRFGDQVIQGLRGT
ncbi:MAG: hypothetical protein E6I45_05580 [Chloroflexi bacterium]|nr:MAG: hypothetical protein E6I45_05580 [Chloroflexota bacterium]